MFKWQAVMCMRGFIFFFIVCFSFWFWFWFWFWFLKRKVIDAQGLVATALFLGDQSLFNTTRDDCIWRRSNDRDQCPDPDITMTLFSAKISRPKLKVPKPTHNYTFSLFLTCRLLFENGQKVNVNVNYFQSDVTQRDWLRNSAWDRDKDNIILLHGYGGSEDALPIVVLRDGKFQLNFVSNYFCVKNRV